MTRLPCLILLLILSACMPTTPDGLRAMAADMEAAEAQARAQARQAEAERARATQSAIEADWQRLAVTQAAQQVMETASAATATAASVEMSARATQASLDAALEAQRLEADRVLREKTADMQLRQAGLWLAIGFGAALTVILFLFAVSVLITKYRRDTIRFLEVRRALALPIGNVVEAEEL